LVSPYRVQTPVSPSIFREFLSALEGNAINITGRNFAELRRLCEEFSFSELAAKLSEFRPSMDFKETETEDGDARGRIAALEENANQHSHVIVMLQDKVTQLSTDFGRLVGEVSALRSVSAGIQTLSKEGSALQTQIGQKLNGPVVEQLSTDFSELRKEVLIMKSQIAAMSPDLAKLRSAVESLSSDLRPLPGGVSALWKFPTVPRLDSRIISDFPEILAEFRGRTFSLLWRGSRDGFEASQFHSRCDGHPNTLTLILDTERNIFGGFTPVEWESGDCWKGDANLRSFVFTLKNPHNIPARRFALKSENKDRAIYSPSQWGPVG
jgi:hypothetical protein